MTNTADKLLNKFQGNINESLGSQEVRQALANATPQPAPTVEHGPEDGRRRNPEAGILAIDRIIPDPNQPRKQFDEAELDRLAESLKTNGQLQPIRVRWSAEHSRWIIVFGERRYRAALRAGIKQLKCEFQEHEFEAAVALETQLVENCLREGLTPIELAFAYQSLAALRRWTAQELAARLNVSDASVSRILALLKLPADVQSLVDGGQLVPSAAYEIARVPDDTLRRLLVAQAIEQGWTREQISAAVQEQLGKRKAAGKATNRISIRLETGTSVAIAATGESLSLRQIIESLESLLRRARKADTQQIPFEQLATFMAMKKLKWTPKTGQSNKLLLAVQERGNHAKETEVPHGGGEGSVALAAVKGDKTVSELASLHGVHPTLIHAWKKQLVENAEELFQSGAKASSAEHEALQAQLYEQIGRLKTELDWLKKKLSASVERKRARVDPADRVLSVSQQCELLGLSRSSYYYEPATESVANLALMALIDKEYTAHPFRGSRGMRAWLRQEGHGVNRKRVQRLMRLMGLEAVYPKPRLSVGGAGHKVYPYLLRNITIERADQVWSTDITYIPMPNGFMYLTAVIDWYSRYVLSWRLSNTLDMEFCLEALEAALQRGCPEVFNTDQGVQFTSASFTGRLEAAGAKVSMDGRGRCLDNVFVERLWRTVKYEYVYLWRPEAVPALAAGLTDYFGYYNDQRSHQSLADRTPAEVYGKRSRSRKGCRAF